VTQHTYDDVPFGPARGRAGWVFTAIWLVYLADPLSRLFDGRHGAPVLAVSIVLVVFFSCAYVGAALLARRDADLLPPYQLGDPRKLVLVGVMAAIAIALPLAVEPYLVVLWIYVSSACGAALPLGRPPSWAMRAGLACAAAMAVESAALDVDAGTWLALLLPCVFSCLGVIGFRGMRGLIRQLRQARAEVARLAAGEERLRMARDLHDLAGHSLATITLKAELARKLLRVDLDRSEQQMLDLEYVSREALADIRKAVSGYRRATLAVETASARTALRAAGMEPDLDRTPAGGRDERGAALRRPHLPGPADRRPGGRRALAHP